MFSIFIKLTTNELNEIHLFLSEGILSIRLLNENNTNSLQRFKTRAKSFFLNSEFNIDLFMKQENRGIRLYPTDKLREKLCHIREIHNEGYLGRNRIESIIKEKIHNVTREEIQEVLNSCVNVSQKDR